MSGRTLKVVNRALAIVLALAIGPAAAWAQAACCCVDLTSVSACCAGSLAAAPSASDEGPLAEEGCSGDCARHTAELEADEQLRWPRLDAPRPMVLGSVMVTLQARSAMVVPGTCAPRGPPPTAAQRQALLQIWTC